MHIVLMLILINTDDQLFRDYLDSLELGLQALSQVKSGQDIKKFKATIDDIERKYNFSAALRAIDEMDRDTYASYVTKYDERMRRIGSAQDKEYLRLLDMQPELMRDIQNTFLIRYIESIYIKIAKRRINYIARAVKDFQIAIGRFPNDTEELLQHFKNDDTRFIPLIDPWKRRIKYKKKSDHNQPFPDIWSEGPPYKQSAIIGNW